MLQAPAKDWAAISGGAKIESGLGLGDNKDKCMCFNLFYVEGLDIEIRRFGLTSLFILQLPRRMRALVLAHVK